MDKRPIPKTWRVGHPASLPKYAPFNGQDDIKLLAESLAMLHGERPDLKIEMFGVEFPTAGVCDKKLQAFQRCVVRSFR